MERNVLKTSAFRLVAMKYRTRRLNLNDSSANRRLTEEWAEGLARPEPSNPKPRAYSGVQVPNMEEGERVCLAFGGFGFNSLRVLGACSDQPRFPWL